MRHNPLNNTGEHWGVASSHDGRCILLQVQDSDGAQARCRLPLSAVDAVVEELLLARNEAYTVRSMTMISDGHSSEEQGE